MRRALCLAALAATLPGSAHAASLWTVWLAARANDPAFLAASAQLRAAATAQPAALAALLPQFSIAAAAGPQNQAFEGADFYGSGFEPIRQDQRIGVSTWQVTLSQTLFDWRRIKTLQAAGFSVQQAAATYQARLEALNVQVITDYVAVLAANDNLASLRAAARGFALQYHDAEARYRAGMDGVIGADESRAAARSIAAQVVQAQTALIAARATLAALTGDQVQVSGSLPIALALPAPGRITTWLARAASGNPTLAAAKLTVRDDAALIAAARGADLPSLSLQLQHTHTAQGGRAGYAFFGQGITGPAYTLQQGNAVTVQMNWNVFSGGATRAAVDRARARRDAAAANAATARLAVIRTVRTDYFAVLLDRARLAAARAAATAAARAVQAAADGVRAGLISASDLIADRQALLSAQLALHAAVVAAIDHEAGLAQAAGSATPLLVHRISTTLSPHAPLQEK
ncbi:TolC family protein [Acidiphilium sp. PA]|uniref:TolC family protein n=1 Tax=Acidiphilium sp. PA TaxID=2871705 RepID=UPI0022430BDB|nr:TolC family protein [Acidiphilium sp. PA]MCW8307596.1 TolC family protein [Acidiphilium sp. PA]